MQTIVVATIALALALAAAPAGAKPAAVMSGGSVGEVVVTAEKRLSEYDPQQTPHVTLTRRADNLITEVRVVCDTRDPAQRRAELKETLRGMIRLAGDSHTIALGQGDDIVGAFDASMLDAVIEPDARTDTSVARVVIKTPISASDTFDAASGRIVGFIKSAPKTGRTEILREDDWNLTIVGPERNRAELLKLIAADAQASAAPFGPGYGFLIDGLQHPIAWYQQGPLDLALYIAYKLQIKPLH